LCYGSYREGVNPPGRIDGLSFHIPGQITAITKKEGSDIMRNIRLISRTSSDSTSILDLLCEGPDRIEEALSSLDWNVKEIIPWGKKEYRDHPVKLASALIGFSEFLEMMYVNRTYEALRIDEVFEKVRRIAEGLKRTGTPPSGELERILLPLTVLDHDLFERAERAFQVITRAVKIAPYIAALARMRLTVRGYSIDEMIDLCTSLLKRNPSGVQLFLFLLASDFFRSAMDPSSERRLLFDELPEEEIISAASLMESFMALPGKKTRPLSLFRLKTRSPLIRYILPVVNTALQLKNEKRRDMILRGCILATGFSGIMGLVRIPGLGNVWPSAEIEGSRMSFERALLECGRDLIQGTEEDICSAVEKLIRTLRDWICEEGPSACESILRLSKEVRGGLRNFAFILSFVYRGSYVPDYSGRFRPDTVLDIMIGGLSLIQDLRDRKTEFLLR